MEDVTLEGVASVLEKLSLPPVVMVFTVAPSIPAVISTIWRQSDAVPHGGVPPALYGAHHPEGEGCRRISC